MLGIPTLMSFKIPLCSSSRGTSGDWKSPWVGLKHILLKRSWLEHYRVIYIQLQTIQGQLPCSVQSLQSSPSQPSQQPEPFQSRSPQQSPNTRLKLESCIYIYIYMFYIRCEYSVQYIYIYLYLNIYHIYIYIKIHIYIQKMKVSEYKISVYIYIQRQPCGTVFNIKTI